MCIGRRPFLGNFLISGSHFLKPATYNHEVTQATKGLYNGGLIKVRQISKRFFQADGSSKKRTNEFGFFLPNSTKNEFASPIIWLNH